MGLLNYTTEVAAEKSVNEIAKALVGAKATSLLYDYDSAGNISALSFRIATKFGPIAFRLPANEAAVKKVLEDQRRRGTRLRAKIDEQARRVAWRILKDWVEAQCALIQVGLAEPEQAFLPYAQNAKGQTLYEAIAETKFSGLALPEK